MAKLILQFIASPQPTLVGKDMDGGETVSLEHLTRHSSTSRRKEVTSTIFVGPLPGPTMKCVCPDHPPPTTLSSEIESCSLWQSHALKPIHFLKAHVNSYSKTATWHKYKDKDNYKYEDKDKDEDAKTITGTLTVCYIFGILMTCPDQPSTAQ